MQVALATRPRQNDASVKLVTVLKQLILIGEHHSQSLIACSHGIERCHAATFNLILHQQGFDIGDTLSPLSCLSPRRQVGRGGSSV